MSSERDNNGTYQMITPANTLKERVGAGLGIDSELAKRADSAVQNLHGEFLQRVSDALNTIAENVTLAENSDSESAEQLAEIYKISGELRAQGVAFGYPLISDICASLCRYVEKLNGSNDPTGKVINAHTDAVRSVIGNAIDGDGGQLGQDLIASLNQLVAKSNP